MLNCKISKGVQAQCDTSIGGIMRLAFANFSKDHVFTNASGDCEVDSIALASGEKAYEVSFLDGTGLAEVELNVGDSTDQKNFTHRITMNLQKLDCDLLEQYKNWSLGHLIAFVQQKDGNVYVYGADNGLAATSFNYTSGSQAGDANGITAIFEGVQLDAPLKLESWDLVKALYPSA